MFQKFVFASLVTAFALVAPAAKADQVPARINYLACGGLKLGSGGLNIVFNGGAFWVTATNAWGFPISQGASIVEVNSETGTDIEFVLQTALSHQRIVLKVYSNGQGVISSNREDMQVVCTGDIRGI